MSTVFLHVGQCGIQMGDHFWNLCLSSNNSNIFSDNYISLEGKRRCLYIDAESKVINKYVKNNVDSIRHENLIAGRKGSGNNWALGYFEPSQSSLTLVSRSEDVLRREIERCDRFLGVVFMHSLSGGTGSGVSSKILELFKDLYPLRYTISCAVAPFTSGEVPIQDFNSLLCLNSLQKYSDSIILFNNDRILNHLLKQKSQGKISSSVSIEQINFHISSCLAGNLLPVDLLYGDQGVSSIGLEPYEMIRSLTPMPNLKFSEIYQLSRSKCSWHDLCKLVPKYIIKYDHLGTAYSSLSNLLVVRGDPLSTFRNYASQFENMVKSSMKPISWNPFPLDTWVSQNNFVDGPSHSTITLTSNRTSVLDSLKQIQINADLKFRARAYLHHYYRYGCEDSHFEEAFESIKTIIKDYKYSIS